MMNNVNMSGMNHMVGAMGGVPMMNNNVNGRMSLPTGSMSSHHGDNMARGHLNTCIYEYFLKNEMFDCARALLASKQPINVDKSSARRRDDNGMNGVNDESMDNDSKDDVKRNDDLPVPIISQMSGEYPNACFLFDWWCLFWDMFHGQHGKSGRENIVPFINHTQHQSRLSQERQQAQLRSLNPQAHMMNNQQYQQMMIRQQGGATMAQNELARQAMQNNRKPTQQQLQMMQHSKQLQQNGVEMDGNRQRPQSPGAENMPSPSKRQRIEGPYPQQGMPNGRGQPMSVMQGQDQLQSFQSQTPNVRAGSIKNYSANLSQQQKAQIPAGVNAGVSPANQGSPMMMEGNTIFDPQYNTNGLGPNGGRGGPTQAGAAGTNGTGNHALQDYQMQLMLLEQQNKKRLMLARQEQDNMVRTDGSTGPYQGASPNGTRTGSSPTPNEMKRGTPQMGTAGIPGSPLPDGPSRGSPALGFNPNHMDPNMAPGFYNNGGMKSMDVGMGGQTANMRPPSSHPNGFQGQPVTPQQQQQQQQQQMLQQQQQRQQQGGGQFPAFQGGPNGGAVMMQNQHSQGGGPSAQSLGTPQQRAMPPPQAPTAGNAPNGQQNRGTTSTASPAQSAAPPTPSQVSKAVPGKNKKNDKEPRKKGSVATLNAGVAPAGDGNAPTGNDGGPSTTPTPATPVTPLHPNTFNKNGQGTQQGVQGPPTHLQASNNPSMNGQQGHQGGGPGAAPQQPNPIQAQSQTQQSMEQQYNMDQFDIGLDMSNPLGFGPPGTDIIDQFDFDQYLIEQADNPDSGFAYDPNFGLDTGEVGAE